MSEIRPARELRHAKSAGEGFVNSAAFEWLSRAGFVARSAIYAIIGVLAFKLAIGSGGKLTDQQGALDTVANQPFGSLLLTLLAIGLGGYAVWRLFRAALGRGPEGSDSGFERLAALVSGLAYGALCVLAVEILVGSGSEQQHQSEQHGCRRPRVAGWPMDRRSGRPGDDRCRALPGLQGNHAEVPRRLEDRGDVSRPSASGSDALERLALSRERSCSA